MGLKKQHIGIRVEHNLNQKFKYVCGYYGDSVNETITGKMREYTVQKDLAEDDGGKESDISLYVDREEHRKFCSVIKNEGLTIKGWTRNVMKAYVKEFEERFGEISEDDLKKM